MGSSAPSPCSAPHTHLAAHPQHCREQGLEHISPTLARPHPHERRGSPKPVRHGTGRQKADPGPCSGMSTIPELPPPALLSREPHPTMSSLSGAGILRTHACSLQVSEIQNNRGSGALCSPHTDPKTERGSPTETSGLGTPCRDPRSWNSCHLPAQPT